MSSAKTTLSWTAAGERAVMLYLPEPPQDDYPLLLRALMGHYRAQFATIIDMVPAYRSLLLVFADSDIPAQAICDSGNDFLTAYNPVQAQQGVTTHTIPVCYAAEYAPDLADLAASHGLSVDEVIAQHTADSYSVCCLGFIPGFAFLGYVDERIATPRHHNPRSKVAKGSVGIAGRQTGIYPADSPGGWQIIGRTPVTLYAPERGLYSRFNIGDKVRFSAISADEFANWTDE
ncbi:5-oxoprolinase subunit PxpB [Cardiobacteriaceae bacterium TAE3-ERU3]|nr:5-oxoprolinase subunit PxpB [Cardiobacteriaceae bacterium TAE3-ERU3]